MKIIDSILYMELSDLVKSGIPENTVYQAKTNKRNSWSFIKDPSDNRRLLCDYEKLSSKYKALALETFGNPYEYISKQPIKDLVTTDFDAHKFFTEYRYGDNNTLSLSDEQVNQFTKAASYMNVIIKCTDEPMFIKKELGLPIIKFLSKVQEIINTEGIRLPGCYKRLNEKIKEYRANGYACLIDKRIFQTNAAKITDEVAATGYGYKNGL